jgi:hypothetical protein
MDLDSSLTFTLNGCLELRVNVDVLQMFSLDNRSLASGLHASASDLQIDDTSDASHCLSMMAHEVIVIVLLLW